MPNSADKITAKQIPKFFPEKETQCKWCGNSKIHSKEQCPAKIVICNAYKKKGHYSRVCRSHIKVNSLTEEENTSSSYLGNLKNSSSEDKWRVNVLVDNKLLHFKIDTSADLTVISQKIFMSVWGNKKKLQTSNKQIFGPDESKLKVLGQFQAKLQNGKQHFIGNIYVVSNLHASLLSCADCEKLNLISRVNEMKARFDPKLEFSKLFTGIGKIEKSLQATDKRRDCGSQFSTTVETSREYKLFSKKYGFSIVTSSRKYSQSNGFIESMVKNFKKHFEKSVDEDPYLMMLVLRTTPLENGYSPAELLMGRKLRTSLPMTKKSPMPKIPEAEEIRRKELKYGVNQKNYYDKQHHRDKDLQELEPGQVVWITDQRSYGRIKAKHAAPRSYFVETPRGIIRRNRFHLRPSSG
ncbi:hypothetical protein AVEN_83690-1 [Araneus ventricosus]|uniref:Integrase catalytic domain-containing protein n=1 Tax=Araneus ventricosus TaxID=182803 RepID=A0A4Y2EVE3_ARAVE|nr:hypothetical protein AVEN_83690-1 [Araneus ventricosus]